VVDHIFLISLNF